VLVDVEERRHHRQLWIVDDVSRCRHELVESVTILGAGDDPAVTHRDRAEHLPLLVERVDAAGLDDQIGQHWRMSTNHSRFLPARPRRHPLPQTQRLIVSGPSGASVFLRTGSPACSVTGEG